MRELLSRRYWDRVKSREDQFTFRALSHPPDFIDYYPAIPASQPERIVFAWLVDHGIGFYFSYYWGDFPFTTDKKERYRPDFILPDYRIIIEVMGVYWHSRSGMYEHDATRTALYLAAGWKVRHLYDIDIVRNVDEAIAREVPEVYTGTIRTAQIRIGDRPFQPGAAITARMRKWPKKIAPRMKSTRRKMPKFEETWETRWRIAQPPTPPSRMFHHTDFTPEYIKELEDFVKEWEEWLEEMAEYFGTPAHRTRWPYEFQRYEEILRWSSMYPPF